MLMYAIKCDEGYLKVSLDHTYIIGSMQKASVYMNVDSVLSIYDKIDFNSNNQLKNPRISQLEITELDYIHNL